MSGEVRESVYGDMEYSGCNIFCGYVLSEEKRESAVGTISGCLRERWREGVNVNFKKMITRA